MLLYGFGRTATFSWSLFCDLGQTILWFDEWSAEHCGIIPINLIKLKTQIVHLEMPCKSLPGQWILQLPTSVESVRRKQSAAWSGPFPFLMWMNIVVPCSIVSLCCTASGTREINGPGLSKASGLLLCSTITSIVLSSPACSAIDNGVFIWRRGISKKNKERGDVV